MESSIENIQQAQARYKKAFDERVWLALLPKKGDYLYLRSEKIDGHQNKLSSRVFGQFDCMSSPDENNQTVLMRRDSHLERFKVYRLVEAEKSDGLVHTLDDLPKELNTEHPSNFYVVQKITNHAQKEKAQPGNRVLEVT